MFFGGIGCILGGRDAVRAGLGYFCGGSGRF